MSNDLPYLVEYAKSSRGACQNCKIKIEKDELRIAAIVQSPFHDGKIPKWYHSTCFFLRQRPESTADIGNFDNIRWEDQEDVKKKLDSASKTPLPAAKGRKRGSVKAAGAAGGSNDFTVQYAKSGQAMCRGCEEKIAKGELRVSKKDYESEDARRYGGLDRWYHLECFAKLRNELGFFESGDTLPGSNSLTKEDKATVKKALPKIKAEDVPPAVKKMKTEPEDAQEEAEMKKQNKELYSVRDTLSTLKKQQLIDLLEKNKQQVPQGTAAILDRLADIVCFGALKPCPKCEGQLVYTSGLGYKCTGDLTEWTKCEYVTQNPDRKKFTIPSDMKDEVPSLGKLKIKRRLIKVVAPSTSSAVKKEDTVDSGPKVQAKPKPLKYMKFVIVGNTEKDKDALKKEIQLLGGSVVTKVDESVTAVIATQKELDRMGKRMETAQDCDVHVITEDFIDEAKEYTQAPTALIKKKTISSWGGDISAKISDAAQKSNASRGKSKFEKSASGKVKLQVKEGGTVDPDSELQDIAHIYHMGKEKFTATLGLTDIQSHKNSFYKLQLLKHDKMKKYWLFRSWGRIGTKIGGHKVESMSLEEAIEQFQALYEEKSGNAWHARNYFVKVPGKMYPIDVDHGEDDDSAPKLLETSVKSDLKEPIQQLMRLIFDIESMKKVMLEFEIDMDEMPLGKLSKKQIQKAYAVLTELQDLLKNGEPESVQLIDATNRFYTLIPHSFGVDGPKVLGTLDEIQEKCKMLDALLEMEVAYNLLHTKTDSSKNPLDSHYEQLKTELDVLDTASEEYSTIEQYLKNTHADTHSSYSLKIQDVFTVKRQGEDKRYKPFKKLPNRKLLWHGSRTTNFVGILSQGLRIAPPEAPVTGYMFGKGIYFADMVSKSANYCCANSQNPTGLLLLCEVALGNMYERFQADYIEKLPKGMHSTFGRGRTHPDPKVEHKLADDVVVPYGPPVATDVKKSALLYNEYIVYDVAQVQAKYLVKVNFDYKS